MSGVSPTIWHNGAHHLALRGHPRSIVSRRRRGHRDRPCDEDMMLAVNLGLKEKVAIVTGSSRGLGLAAAHALAAEGCRVVVCARSEGPLQVAARHVAEAAGG